MLSSNHARAQAEAVSHPTLTDTLTGLGNRLYFESVYRYMFEAGDRGMVFTLMLVSTGQPGDTSFDQIRAIGRAIEGTTRTSDMVCHLGEGRFVGLLLATNLQGARIAADRVEMALEGLGPGPFSLGLAAYGPEMKRSVELLEAVEGALAKAEAAGGGLEFG